MTGGRSATRSVDSTGSGRRWLEWAFVDGGLGLTLARQCGVARARRSRRHARGRGVFEAPCSIPLFVGHVVELAVEATALSVSASAASDGSTLVAVVVASKRDTLTWLFEAIGGRGWTRKTGWRESSALQLVSWDGVGINECGDVVALQLRRNGLLGACMCGPLVWKYTRTAVQQAAARSPPTLSISWCSDIMAPHAPLALSLLAGFHRVKF